MDIFINPVDSEKFRSTNDLWNKLGLNAPDNIGIVSELITQKSFSCKEEWEKYYYEKGRSKEYLKDVAKKLHNNLPTNSNITFKDCCWMVWFRIIGETWNGVIVRETNTIKILNQIYQNIFTFKKTEGDFDNKFGVDYEMFHGNKLLCGIQIKPSSYNESNANHLIRARKTNEIRNKNYQHSFNVPVVTLTSKMNGDITSIEERMVLDSYYLKYLSE